MKVRVYRVEHEELPECGPFATGMVHTIFPKDYHSRDSGFPVPSDDGIACNWYFSLGRVCGCVSLRQLLKWFPAWAIRALRDDDYGIAIYEVDEEHILYGRTQVVFDRTKAERILFK